MKTIIYITTLMILFSCNKEVIQQKKSVIKKPNVEYILNPKKMYGRWQYTHINNQVSNFGVFDKIQITEFTTFYVSFPMFQNNWDVYQNRARGINEEELLKVTFEGDSIMYFQGDETQTKWRLKRIN